MSKTIKISPRDFILPPYKKCPFCGKQEFGVLLIQGHSYMRRCRNCRKEAWLPLPPLQKKVIVLDQFVISNMMKAINQNTNANKRGNVDEFWLELFEILDVLARGQMIVCPFTDIHSDESIPTPFFDELERMYYQLSHGNRFEFADFIHQMQLADHAQKWLKDDLDNYCPVIDRGMVIHESLDKWDSRFVVMADSKFNEVFLDDLLKEREIIHSQMKEVFDYWKRNPDKTFEDWFHNEVAEYSNSITGEFVRFYLKLKAVQDGEINPNPLELIPPDSVVIIESLKRLFIKEMVSEKKAIVKVLEYINSDLGKVPFIKITAMLYAAIARKAIGGQKTPPNQGMVNDVKLISTTLPYVDAIFIDNYCAGLLSEAPLDSELNYGCRIFSQNSKDLFLEYLNSLKESMTDEHKGLLNDVYGDRWCVPYRSMYSNENTS